MKSTWITHFEKSGFVSSPRYNESMAYFKKMTVHSKYAKMFSIGSSPQGRSIECIVISKGEEFTPEKAKASGKAVVLIQNGIHAGEIEGKDACMILLRDILVTREKEHLLDHVILLVIPILSVDGHERISQYNRPNQNGPVEMGWRTNSRNLNLNRDYMKADSPEIKAFLKLFNAWLPDFFIDNHTTNGADYQYHITYALERFNNIDAKLGKWGKNKFIPFVLNAVEKCGFLTAQYIEMKARNLENGIVDTPMLPRLSTGYTSVQNRLGLLVETHSLKPYENRVRSTLAMNVAALEFLNIHFQVLKKLNRIADAEAKKLKSLPISFELTGKSKLVKFKGFNSFYEHSSITGDSVVRYTAKPCEFEIPLFDIVRTTKSLKVPKAYVLPKEFGYIADILKLHGIKIKQITTQKRLSVEQYQFDESTFAKKPYEGRYCVEVKCRSIRTTCTFPKGTFIVPAHQRTLRVIMNLLEPEAPDSFVSWGFFNAFFERKEYAEPYIMEPVAQQMLASDKHLRRMFFDQLQNEAFRNDPESRLDFFYQRSQYFDNYEKKYPIFRMI